MVIGSTLSAKAMYKSKAEHQFSFCLNTSTIMEQDVGLERELQIVAETGYDGIEIWMRTLQRFVDGGGNTDFLKSKATDLGIAIENSIGFAPWIVEDENERKKGLEQIKKEMDLLARVGCKRIAAPPFGATESEKIELSKVAERFYQVCELGKEMGVTPQLELWGFSNNLSRFGEALYVLAECGHPDAILLPDVYHLRRGGSPFESLDILNGTRIEMFHINDYPGDIPSDELTDEMRVFPGDGDAPMNDILQSLHSKNREIVLSLEIFNRDVWKMDPIVAARLGLEKMKNVVEKAI